MPSTSTRCWSRFTLTLVSLPRPWASWILSWMTSLKELLLRLPALPTTTRGRPSLPGRSKRLSGSSFPESWPSTPSLKEPRLSPSTLAPSKVCYRYYQASSYTTTTHPKSPFQGCHNFKKDCHGSSVTSYTVFKTNNRYFLCLKQNKKFSKSLFLALIFEWKKLPNPAWLWLKELGKSFQTRPTRGL